MGLGCESEVDYFAERLLAFLDQYHEVLRLQVPVGYTLLMKANQRLDHLPKYLGCHLLWQ